MGCTHRLERLFVGSPRRGVRIVFFIDIAFGVAGTIFALWISVRPRVDDYGGAAPWLLGPIVGLVGLLFGQRGLARTSGASAEAYGREKKEGRTEDLPLPLVPLRHV